MVRTLLLASSSISSSSDTTTTASRDSTGSSNDSNSSVSSDFVLLADCDSSRPSSVTEEDEFNRINGSSINGTWNSGKKTKYLSKLSRFSSVFRKDPAKIPSGTNGSAPLTVKRMSVTAKEVLRKYLKKVKPLYEKLSQKQQQQKMPKTTGNSANVTVCVKQDQETKKDGGLDQIPCSEINKRLSFSGNLRYPRKRTNVTSCPSSMRSSPTHSGVLSCRRGFITPQTSVNGGMHFGDSSSMEELHSAIQGAIAHCKNSMTPSKNMVSNEICEFA